MADVTKPIFDVVLADVTGGIIPDVTTAIIGCVVILVIYVGFDIVFQAVFGFSLSEEIDYQQYKSRFVRSERFKERLLEDSLSSTIQSAKKQMGAIK